MTPAEKIADLRRRSVRVWCLFAVAVVVMAALLIAFMSTEDTVWLGVLGAWYFLVDYTLAPNSRLGRWL